MMMNSAELQLRLKKFSYWLIPLYEFFPSKKRSKIIEDQLLRSAFSDAAPANHRAAFKAQSDKAFKSRLSISFEEMDGALFWLEVISDTGLIAADKLSLLLNEASELTKILAASPKTMEKKLSN